MSRITPLLSGTEKRVLTQLRQAMHGHTTSRSVPIAPKDRTAGDSLVMRGLAARTRDGRLEATLAGLRADLR